MTRKEFLLSAAVAPSFLKAQQKRLNVIFILTDDHRWDMMGCAGHPWLKTPNLDRLAEGGALFSNAFVTTSLCSPSRASILTGQYAHSHCVNNNFDVLRPGVETFGQLLNRAGYRTAFIGKWHMGDPALEQKNLQDDNSDMQQPGWQQWISFRGQGVYQDPLLNINGVRQKVSGYITDILTAMSLEFLRKQTPDQPFILYLSHKAVHAGFEPASRHKGMYRNMPVPRPASAADTVVNYQGKPDWVRRKAQESRHGLKHLYAGELTFDELYRRYCETLMAVDEGVGALVDELQRLRLRENTLILYAGDNGFLFGEHGLVDKRAMYEPSMRIPLIAHCPALNTATRKPQQLALNIDICPTVLTAAGLLIPNNVHGRSLIPLVQGTPSDWRQDFLYEYFWDYEALHTPTVIGLRTNRHSYMSYQGIWDIDELYDIQSDPNQMNNLIGKARISTQPGGLVNNIPDPALRSQVQYYRKRMRQILNETNGRLYPNWYRPANFQ